MSAQVSNPSAAVGASGGSRRGGSGRGNGNRGGRGGRGGHINKHRPRCGLCNKRGHVMKNCPGFIVLEYLARTGQLQQGHQQQSVVGLVPRGPIANQETTIMGTQASRASANDGSNAIVASPAQQMEQMQRRMAELREDIRRGFANRNSIGSTNGQTGRMASQSTQNEGVQRAAEGQEGQLPDASSEHTDGDKDLINFGDSNVQ